MAAWLFKCTGIQTTSWREGTVSVGILLLFHVQEIINLQREKTYFRSQFSWFQSTIVYVALGAVARKHIMIKKCMSDQKQDKEERREEKKGVTPYWWFNDLKTSLLSRLSHFPPVPCWGPSLCHMGLWKTLGVQSTAVACCWFYPHSLPPLWNTGALELPGAHVPFGSSVSSLGLWIHQKKGRV